MRQLRGAWISALLLAGCGPDWDSLLDGHVGGGAQDASPDVTPAETLDAGGGILPVVQTAELTRARPRDAGSSDAGIEAGPPIPKAR